MLIQSSACILDTGKVGSQAVIYLKRMVHGCIDARQFLDLKYVPKRERLSNLRQKGALSTRECSACARFSHPETGSYAEGKLRANLNRTGSGSSSSSDVPE